MPGFSPLELFHPDGNARQALVLGSGCPERLIPRALTGNEGTVDLAILAPTWQECRLPGWNERSTETAARQLASTGVVYVIAPWLPRRAIRRALYQQGLTVVQPYLHLPDWSASRYFVPLDPGSARYAFTNLFPTRPALRILALTLLRIPGGDALAGDLLPNVGFSAQRAGNRPLFGWVEQWLGDGDQRWSILASASWRDQHCSLVMHLFSGEEQPRLVIKAESLATQEADRETEFNVLQQLGETARRAGATVPQPVAQEKAGDWQVFAQQALKGSSAAALLAGHPQRIPGLLERAARWLETWNLATVERVPLSADLLEKTLYGPLNSLLHLLPEWQAYREWLADLIPDSAEPIPLVAAHNDLTVWNILVERNQPLGVVDWKEARPGGLPLGDLFYMLVDAVSVAHKIDRISAFRACFTPVGRYAALASRLRIETQKALQLSPKLADLCLHGCFLRHAANEQAGLNPEDNREFLQIAHMLAGERVALQWESLDG